MTQIYLGATLQEMPGLFPTIPRGAVLVIGAVAGALTSFLRTRKGIPVDIGGIQDAVGKLEKRIGSQEEANRVKFSELSEKLTEHDKKLQEMPSTSQIVAAMEELLSKSMENLDQRLSTQAHSIDVLKTTVSQTDDLLEKVLEALDSIRQPA